MTTNSDGGIESYEAYYPVFEAMQEVDMVLNLHGEVPSDAKNVSHDLLSLRDLTIHAIEHPRSERRSPIPSPPLQATCRLPQTPYRP